MTVEFSGRAKRRKPFGWGQLILHIVFILACLSYILPFLLVISISFSEEADLIKNGYSLIPKHFTTLAYRAVFKNPTQIINSYRVTAEFSLLSMALMLLVQSMCAYAISRSNFKYRQVVTYLLFFTMLFNGGMVPSYVINSKYLHLKDSFWIYVLPCLVSAWNVFVMRTNFKQLPDGLIEAAKIDGASEMRICFQIVLPLCVPVLATLAFSFFVGQWNSWTTTMIYITSPRLYSLQYLLQKILAEAEFLKQMADQGTINEATDLVPTDSLTYAMAMVAAGPVLVIFPLFQKYFVRGMTIGSVKG